MITEQGQVIMNFARYLLNLFNIQLTDIEIAVLVITILCALFPIICSMWLFIKENNTNN